MPFDDYLNQPSMYGGVHEQVRPDLAGLGNIFGGNTAGPMLQMALGPILQQMSGGKYMSAQFSPEFNLASQYRARSFFLEQQEAMREGAARDRNTYFEMARGVAALSGTPFRAREREAANQIANDISKVMPFMAMVAPDLVDQAHGLRGSSAIMGQQVALAGRYAVDPLTGQFGYSPETTRKFGGELFKAMYGDDRKISEMQGIGAGRAGMMFEEFQRRGLMGSPLGRDAAIQEVAKQENVTVSELRKANDTGQVDDKVLAAEAKRYGERLKGLVGSVVAMQDVFAENGRPDAPMPVLVNALQMMAGSRMASMSPSEMEQMVRRAGETARTTGLGLEGLMRMAGEANKTMAAAGIRPGAAGVEAASAAANYASVFSGKPGPGSLTKEELTYTRARLNAQALISPAANQIGALLRAGDLGAFTPGSQGEALYKSLQNNRTSFEDPGQGGQTVPIDMSVAQMRAITDRDSKFPGLAGQLSMQAASNLERAKGNPDLLANWQVRDLRRRAASQIGLAATGAGIAGLGADQGLNLNSELFSFFSNPPTDVYRGDAAAASQFLAGRLEGKGVNVSDQQKEQLRRFAAVAWGNMDILAKQSGFPSKDAVFQSLSPATLEASRMKAEVDNADAEFATALAPLGRSQPAQRIAEVLRHASSKTTLRGSLAEIAGMIPADRVNDALRNELKDFLRIKSGSDNFSPGRTQEEAHALQAAEQAAAGRGDAAGAAEARKNLEDLAERTLGTRDTKSLFVPENVLRVQARRHATSLLVGRRAELQKKLDEMARRQPGDRLQAVAELSERATRPLLAATVGADAADMLSPLLERAVGRAGDIAASVPGWLHDKGWTDAAARRVKTEAATPKAPTPPATKVEVSLKWPKDVKFSGTLDLLNNDTNLTPV